MRVPFNDFPAEFVRLERELCRTVRRVLRRGIYVLGEEVESFEREFAAFIGVPYCVGVASGTEAIALSLMTLGVCPGDEVITADMTAFPTVTGILQAGATPVVVDVRGEDGLIDPARIEAKVTSRTRAIVPVHLYGQSCEMAPILRIARRHGLKVVEDCAHSAGATYRGDLTGSIGDCGAFSFYPTKPLGAYGDGGAVTTRSKESFERLRRLRNYGKRGRDLFQSFGINSRLDELQAALLRVKLRNLARWNRERGRLASFYRRGLGESHCLRANAYGNPVYHLFVIRTGDRARVVRHLSRHAIETFVHYPFPVHRQRAFGRQRDETFPKAELLSAEALSIPLRPGLEPAQASFVVRRLREVLA